MNQDAEKGKLKLSHTPHSHTYTFHLSHTHNSHIPQTCISNTPHTSHTLRLPHITSYIPTQIPRPPDYISQCTLHSLHTPLTSLYTYTHTRPYMPHTSQILLPQTYHTSSQLPHPIHSTYPPHHTSPHTSHTSYTHQTPVMPHIP